MYKKTDRITLFDRISHPIIVLDNQCQIVDLNHAMIKLANRPKERMIGNKCYHMAAGGDKYCCESPGLTCPIDHALEKKQVVRFIQERKYNKRPAQEEVVATPVFGDDKKIEYIILELSDISELVNTKEAVINLRDEVTSLKKIIPICASCKKIRDDEGFWQNVENYMSSRMQAQFSHSICPKCMKDKHPEICMIDPVICTDDKN